MAESAQVNPPRASYGIDAPLAFTFVAILAVLCSMMAIFNAITAHRFFPLVPAIIICTIAGFLFHTTLRGKFIAWDRLLDGLDLRGDERILDMGCGRGAVLILAAKRLTTGRAVGVDVWRSFDQSGNSQDATQRNALAEGVADRVELHTADMTALPFPDESFDFIVSSYAIHNIPRTTREKAIDEAVRVLRPGGRLLITDVRATRSHERRLRELGMSDVTRRAMGWHMWMGGPWAPTRLVCAKKPGR